MSLTWPGGICGRVIGRIVMEPGAEPVTILCTEPPGHEPPCRCDAESVDPATGAVQVTRHS